MAILGNTTTNELNSTAFTNDHAYAIKITTTEETPVDSISFFARNGNASYPDCKGVIWKVSDGSLVAVGSVVRVVNYSPAQWYVSTFGSTTLDDATEYWAGIIVDDIGPGYGKIYFVPPTELGYQTTENNHGYDSPTTFVPNYFWYYYNIYLTYTPAGGPSEGPDLLVEGITPGKVEGVNWGDLADIK